MSALILIPTFNEKDNLEKLIEGIFVLGLDTKILIIDDNSPDGTGKLADKLASADSRIAVLHRPEKQGLGKAYLDGFRYAVKNYNTDYIIQMDADLSHNPSHIPQFLEEIKDCDVVIGSRFFQGRIGITNWSLLRIIFSWCAGKYVNLFTRLAISDPTSGFKCFRRRIIEKILEKGIISNGYAFQIEVNYLCRKMGFTMVEIPIIFYDRQRGASKLSTFYTVLEAMFIVWRLKFRKF